MTFDFSKEEADKYVWEYFARKSGIKDQAKLARLQKTAYRYKDTAGIQIDLKAAVTEAAGFAVNDGRLVIEGRDMGDIGIRDDDAGKIEKVYSYVLCAGKFETDIDPITDGFADLWGNAYCDVCHRLVKEKLAALGKAGMMVSPPFGPGFFGMGMENLPQIMELAGADRIGVSFTGNYMLPLKSCAGFFFTSKTPLNLPAKDCASCTGSRLSCSYCRNYS